MSENSSCLPACLRLPSMRPLQRHVEISVSPEEYFWMAATSVCEARDKPAGRPNVVQVPCFLIYFRHPPLSRQTREIDPCALDCEYDHSRLICANRRAFFIEILEPRGSLTRGDEYYLVSLNLVFHTNVCTQRL